MNTAESQYLAGTFTSKVNDLSAIRVQLGTTRALQTLEERSATSSLLVLIDELLGVGSLLLQHARERATVRDKKNLVATNGAGRNEDNRRMLLLTVLATLVLRASKPQVVPFAHQRAKLLELAARALGNRSQSLFSVPSDAVIVPVGFGVFVVGQEYDMPKRAHDGRGANEYPCPNEWKRPGHCQTACKTSACCCDCGCPLLYAQWSLQTRPVLWRTRKNGQNSTYLKK